MGKSGGESEKHDFGMIDTNEGGEGKGGRNRGSNAPASSKRKDIGGKEGGSYMWTFFRPPIFQMSVWECVRRRRRRKRERESDGRRTARPPTLIEWEEEEEEASVLLHFCRRAIIAE